MKVGCNSDAMLLTRLVEGVVVVVVVENSGAVGGDLQPYEKGGGSLGRQALQWIV